MPRFPGVDYLHIDSLFSEQELMVRQTARQFVEDRVIPLVRDSFRDGKFPKELIAELARLGFLGANLDGYGCAGMNNVEYGLIAQELERADSGLRSFISVQGALVMYPILTFGSDEQKERWLPKMQAGEALGCFGLTEPGFGSNPAGMLTKARKDGDHWIIDGEKTWITNGSVADVALVWARTPEGIRGFLVDKGTPGFSASELHGKLRRGPRVPVRMPILLKSSGPGEPWEEVTESQTLSLHGMRVASQHQLRVRDALTCMRLDNRRQTQARVVWARPLASGVTEAGLEFTSGEDFWGLAPFDVASYSKP